MCWPAMPTYTFMNFQVRVGLHTFINSLLDRTDALFNIEHDTMAHSCRISFAETQYLQFSEFVFPSGYRPTTLVVPMSRPTMMGCSFLFITLDV